MDNIFNLNKNVIRKEAWDKVTGAAKYNCDSNLTHTLHGKILTSEYSHAIIKNINITKAKKSKGVQSIITGDYSSVLTGSIINDRPILAKDKVRYYGEPVCIVVANSEEEAAAALKLIEIEYEPLPVINSIDEALEKKSILVHEQNGRYYCPDIGVYPVIDTNIADLVKIRKGSMEAGWDKSHVIIEADFYLPATDHIAMETRNSDTQILPSGDIVVNTSTQGPFTVKEGISKSFNETEGNVVVKTPLVGGAFGGKAGAYVELLTYIASLSVEGKKVRIASTREEDISTWPTNICTKTHMKLGASRDGVIQALEIINYVDIGAYAGTGPRISKSMAINFTGPYNIENVYCDSYSIYTNHIFVTSFRGFGHLELTFCIERMIEKLAKELNMDSFAIRTINAIKEGNYSPTGTRITLSNSGSITECLEVLKKRINWREGHIRHTDKGTIITKGIASFWKSSNSPTNASSGALLLFNSDGSINLNVGAVEIGPGMKTQLAQILAEKLKMDMNQIHVTMEVDTRMIPKHWKTVASMTIFMVGNAVLNAAEDVIRQLKALGGIIFKCPPDNIQVANQRIYMNDDPCNYKDFKDVVHGYKYQGGESIFGQIIGRGTYIMQKLTDLDPETGMGRSSPSWTVGAQAVEIEYNPKNYSYRILSASTVIDSGKVINTKFSKGVVMGGMSMGIGVATREELKYDKKAVLENSSLRTYKLLRIGQQPVYTVDFVENPQIDAPYGSRGIGEHGILAIPAAIANALSLASNVELDKLPIAPEEIWKIKSGGKYDSI